jgi:hypothetical protein
MRIGRADRVTDGGIPGVAVAAPAFGDVQLAGVFDGGADGGLAGGPLPLGETVGTRAQVAADARLVETGVLRRTIGAWHTGSGPSPVC